MATYDRGRHIVPSISSVLEQSLQDFELLVIGDCVTDDTPNVIADFASLKIKWINLPERTGSQSEPNNRGIDEARGTYIAYLGHDDVWSPDHLTKLYEAYKSFDAEFVYSGVILHQSLESRRKPRTLGLRPFGLCTEEHHVPPSGISHRRDVMHRISRWPEQGSVNRPIDIYFEIKAREAGLRFAATGNLTVHKFSAADRYLTYLDPSSDEQEMLLDHLLSRKESKVFKENIEDAHDAKAALPGRLHWANDKPIQDVNFPLVKITKDVFRGLLPNPIVLVRPLSFEMTSEERGYDWGKMCEATSGFRQSGPSKRPRLLIPALTSDPVWIIISVLAQNEDQFRRLSFKVNGDLVDHKIINLNMKESSLFADLKMIAVLRSDASSVLQIVQDEAKLLTDKKQPHSLIAVGNMRVRHCSFVSNIRNVWKARKNWGSLKAALHEPVKPTDLLRPWEARRRR
ncbi:MAG: glycosyltransferase family 2 protein [Pseudomonadota bacterium]